CSKWVALIKPLSDIIVKIIRQLNKNFWTMKITKIAFLAIAFVTASIATANAQRFAYVDTEYILHHIPEYLSAQKQLDDLSVTWQDEIDARFAEVENLYQAYQQEQVLLSEEMRQRREEEIIQKELETKEYQRQKF